VGIAARLVLFGEEFNEEEAEWIGVTLDEDEVVEEGGEAAEPLPLGGIRGNSARSTGGVVSSSGIRGGWERDLERVETSLLLARLENDFELFKLIFKFRSDP
jgi:hypothetical protein